jgi:hypothetical protein
MEFRFNGCSYFGRHGVANDLIGYLSGRSFHPDVPYQPHARTDQSYQTAPQFSPTLAISLDPTMSRRDDSFDKVPLLPNLVGGKDDCYRQ